MPVKNKLNQVFVKGNTYQNVLDKKTVWQELEKKYEGKLRVTKTKSGDGMSLTLEINYHQQTIVLRETDAMALKIETTFNYPLEMEFTISRKDWMMKLLAHVNPNFLKTGIRAFDDKFILKSRFRDPALALVSSDSFSIQIVNNNPYLLSLFYSNTCKSYQLLLVKDRNVKTVEEISDLIGLMCFIIDSVKVESKYWMGGTKLY